MTTDLQGRTAAITGASSGIGAATAIALARAGAAVALAARRGDRIERLAAEIEAEGGRAVALPTDVSVESEARAFVAHAYEHLGGVDLLVNNAGAMLLGAIEGADTADWRRMVEANIYGVLYCTHAALPVMREGGGGDIVNISSTAGRFAGAGSGVYNVTKFGVNAFTEALRQEAIDAGIRVTVIEPGFVETELQGHNSDPAVQQAIARAREDTGEVLQPEDIADAVLYSVSRPSHVAISEMLIRPARQRR